MRRREVRTAARFASAWRCRHSVEVCAATSRAWSSSAWRMRSSVEQARRVALSAGAAPAKAAPRGRWHDGPGVVIPGPARSGHHVVGGGPSSAAGSVGGRRLGRQHGQLRRAARRGPARRGRAPRGPGLVAALLDGFVLEGTLDFLVLRPRARRLGADQLRQFPARRRRPSGQRLRRDVGSPAWSGPGPRRGACSLDSEDSAFTV